MKSGKDRVLILTTAGPVEVLRLTREDPEIGRSVACIGGTSETAGISAAYNAFVSRTTGVVERLAGQGAFASTCPHASMPAQAGSSVSSLLICFTRRGGLRERGMTHRLF